MDILTIISLLTLSTNLAKTVIESNLENLSSLVKTVVAMLLEFEELETLIMLTIDIVVNQDFSRGKITSLILILAKIIRKIFTGM